MRRYLPELIALPLLPLLIAQGRYTRRVTPRLAEAAGPCAGWAGSVYDGPPLTLLTVGESPVAGVGVSTHEEAITGQLAHALARRHTRPVHWRACGKNGVTVREALHEVVPAMPERTVDVALVAFGVNDTTAFHSVRRWQADLHALLAAVDARCKPRLLLLSGVPPLAHFPALPHPLRWVMGLKAEALDRAARELAPTRPRTLHVPLPLATRDASMMASDGYHPSAKGCAAWAQLLANACLPHLCAGDGAASDFS